MFRKKNLHGEILKRCPQQVFIIVARKIDIRIVRGLFVFFFFLLIFLTYVIDTLLKSLEVLPMSINAIIQLMHSFEVSI